MFLVAQSAAAQQVDVVGVGHEFPFEALGRCPLFAAMVSQTSGFLRVVDPLVSVNEGLELAMSHQVRIASNRGGEVHVGIEVQPEVAAVHLRIVRPLHELEQPLVDNATGGFVQAAGGGLRFAERGQNPLASLGVNDIGEVGGHLGFVGRGLGLSQSGGVDGQTATCPVAQQVGQFIGLRFTVLAQARHGELNSDVEGGQFGVEFLHLGAVGGCVASPRQGSLRLAQKMAYGSVGGHHERLDHAGGVVGPLDLHAQFVIAVHPRAQFGVVEVQAGFTALPHGRQRQHVVVSVGLSHVAVCDVRFNVNDRFVGMGTNDVVLGVEVHAHHHRQSVHASSQRAEVIGQARRQHWEHGVGQVHRSGTCCSGAVEG